jgi:hypothetical protein
MTVLAGLAVTSVLYLKMDQLFGDAAIPLRAADIVISTIVGQL